MSQPTSYVPGVCNINPVEIRRRRITGYVGLILTILLLSLLLATDIDRWYRLLILAPAFVAAISFLQARNRFCVAFARSNSHHADDSAVTKVTDQKSILLDALKARKINLQASAIALAVTLIALALPMP